MPDKNGLDNKYSYHSVHWPCWQVISKKHRSLKRLHKSISLLKWSTYSFTVNFSTEIIVSLIYKTMKSKEFNNFKQSIKTCRKCLRMYSIASYTQTFPVDHHTVVCSISKDNRLKFPIINSLSSFHSNSFWLFFFDFNIFESVNKQIQHVFLK